MMKKKEQRKRIESTKANYDTDMSKMIKILCAVVICFVVIYFGTAIVKGELFGKKTTTEPEIQKQQILITETFEKEDTEYMVLFYDFGDKLYSGLYNMLVENYSYNNKDIYLYIVDLSSGLSNKYLVSDGEASNTKVNSLSNLKLNGATLIRIKDKKVTKYIEGKDNIKSYIDSLI